MQLLFALFALLAPVVAPCTAVAHAVVLETVPDDGALLDAAPREVVVRFSEPVRPIRVQILDAAGAELTERGALTVDGPDLRIALPASVELGSYIASFRVVSLDSHPVSGSTIFSVGRVSSNVAAPAGTDNDLFWRVAIALVRALLYVGILGAAGAVLFLALVLREVGPAARSARAVASTFAAVGCGASLSAVGVQGALLLNGTLGSLAAAETWRIGLTSSYGLTAVTALGALALVAVGVRSGHRPGPRAFSQLGAGLAVASVALSGHVVTAGPRWLTIPILVTHTAAAAFWAGSLLPLFQIVGSRDADASLFVARFSRLAVGVVLSLILAGTAIAVMQVRDPGALLTTSYGIALITKVGLAAGLIALAAYNKLRLTPALARGEPAAQTAFRRTIAAELAFVLAILAATGVLGTRPPPRALSEGAAHASHLSGSGSRTGLALVVVRDQRSIEIVLASSSSGPNRALITLTDTDGRSIDAQEVTIIASNPGAGVEAFSRRAERGDDGEWLVSDLLLAPAGRWTLRVDVLITDFELAKFSTRLDLAQPGAGGGA